ncbi:uncharacterized protein E0L32_011461 [Thyridium curvatum]|uniref:Ubiquitin-like protein ATG12 n=1 Tax=Thyridium curvatum TaxID=1093900 RepID=A0A507BHJ6_9PEZI|nr:uncharacterized protein E0L32_011461 [Thyridium curvatum]TPX18846.1 hypothetical protein E0L32_011461 [Thyridium curvatum]
MEERQPTPSPPAAAAASPTIPSREQSPDLPLTLTASAVLTRLPRDALGAAAEAVSALEGQGQGQGDRKVVVRFKPVGSAPAVRRELCKISAGQKFEAVVAYLRRVLRVGPGESVFLYVNSTFAPALDEVVGNLHRCFKDSNGQLNVSYSMTPAFG